MNNSHTKNVALLALLIGISGCGHFQAMGSKSNAATEQANALERERQAIQERENALAQREAQLGNLQRQISVQRQQLAEESRRKGTPVPSRSNTDDLFPPNPRPGECYARVIQPATFRTINDRVLIKEPSEKIVVVPAEYRSTNERVVIKEASSELKVIPAQYETVTERVLVKPASRKMVQVPAKYKTVSEQVVDQPAHTAWKKGTGIGYGKGSNVGFGGAADQVQRFEKQDIIETRVEDTGEVMCLVNVPATYKTVTRQVLVSKPSTREIAVPAEYKTITKRVLKRPASVQEVNIPAEYSTVQVQQLVRAEQQRRITIPAKYETVSRSEKVNEEKIAWRPVLCEVNMTKTNVASLQTALADTGCFKCDPDGVIGKCTMNAVQCYAEPRGLPSSSKYVTMDVIKSLGLRF